MLQFWGKTLSLENLTLCSWDLQLIQAHLHYGRCIRVLQRNGIGHACLVYYKKLAYQITEAEKCQNLQSAVWRPVRANGRVPVQNPAGSTRWMSWYFSLSPKAGKDWCPSSSSQMERFPFTHERARFFVLFRTSTDWVRPTHIREGNLLGSVYWFKC